MKILVVGGYGDIGGCVVEKLLDFSSHQVSIAGRDLKKARAFCQTIKDHVGALQVELHERATLTAACENFDLVINCAGPFYKFRAEVATSAIETRTHYIDICDDPEPLPKLFALDEAAKRAGVTVLTGMGLSPGIANLSARLSANLLDNIDDINIAWAVGSNASKGLAALCHTLHGITGDVPVFRNGKMGKVPAWTEMEMVEYPAPLGEIPGLMFGHPEPVTLSKTVKAKNITLKGGISPPWNNKALSFVRSLGFTKSDGRIDTIARIMHKTQRLFSIGGAEDAGLRIDVTGKKDGQERHLVFNMVDNFRELVATSCAVGSLMLLDGKIKKRGVVAPEMCIDPVEFFDKIADKGIRILREGRL